MISWFSVSAMWCQDPFLSILRRYQYLPVAMPRASIAPRLLLAGRPERLYEIGDLCEVVSGNVVEPPPVRRNDPVPELTGVLTNSVDAGLGAAISTRLAIAMGLDATEVRAKVDNQQRMAFHFSSVLEDSISLTDLDRFLSLGTPSLSESYATTLLLESHLYIVVSTIKSASFGVRFGKDSEHDGSTQVEAGGVGSVSGRISAAQSAGHTVLFGGELPIVFGVRAVRLFYNDGRFTRWRQIDSGKAAMRSFSKQALDPDAEYLTENTEGFAHLDSQSSTREIQEES